MVILVQASYGRLQAANVPLGPLFYQRLFEAAPSVRPMFKKDISGQTGKFEKMLKYLIEGLGADNASQHKLESLGRAHRGMGAVEAHYHVVADVLIGTLAEAEGPEFTPRVEAAWRSLLGHVAQVMLEAPEVQRMEA